MFKQKANRSNDAGRTTYPERKPSFHLDMTDSRRGRKETEGKERERGSSRRSSKLRRRRLDRPPGRCCRAGEGKVSAQIGREGAAALRRLAE